MIPAWRGQSDEGASQAKGRRIIRSPEEHELFLSRSERYPRYVLGQAFTMNRPVPRLLSDVLKKTVTRTLRSDQGIWRGFVIAVDESDGMTWSAASADRVIGENSPLPRFQLVPEPRVDGLPRIVELVPKRRLITLAQEKEAVRQLPALRRQSIAIAILLLLALGAATAALQAFTKALGGVDLLLPVLGALLAGLLFAGQEVSVRLKRSERLAEEKTLIEALAAPKGRPDAWEALTEALSEELAKTTRDRAVIVDGFDRLDQITRDTLSHYLTHRSHAADAHELWVIFEDGQLASLTKKIQLEKVRTKRSRLARLETLRLLSLDEVSRSRLAAEVGHPERADFRWVKSIAGVDSELTDVYARLFDEEQTVQQHDVRPYGPLEIAYLLAVQHRTDAWGFREGELIGELSSKASSAQAEVLRLLLPGASFSRDEVGDAIVRLRSDLARALDPEHLAAGEIELVTEAAQTLVERRENYGLPPNDLVHLYWALYWYSRLGGALSVDAYCLRKLARHLVSAATPGALEGGVGDEVRRRFREALIWTANALLAASLFEEVPKLLARAEREAGAGEDQARLRSACWQAYAVLGDEDLLAIILRLHTGTAGSAPAVDSPESLFVESLPLIDPLSSRQELSKRLLSLDQDVQAYAQVRGLWLALSLAPVSAGSWSNFAKAAAEAAPLAASLVRQGLELLEDPVRPRTAIAAMTVSLGMWCYALGFSRSECDLGEANGLLDDVRRQAARLHKALDGRRRRGESDDFMLRAFANEFEAVAGAAAVLLSVTLTSEPAESDAERLRSHVFEASGSTASEASVHAHRIGQQMTLQALIWRTLGSSSQKPLGLDQPAAFIALRQVHLAILIDGPEAVRLNNTLSELAEQLVVRGVVGLIAHALAVHTAQSDEIKAHLWARAVDLALASDFGERLEIELCLAALGYCHPFHSVPAPNLTKRLLGVNGFAVAQSHLGERLRDLDEEMLDNVALWLLNAARTSEVSPAEVEALVAEAKAMSDYTESDAIKDEIRQVVELFEFEHGCDEERSVSEAEVLARWESRRDSPHYVWMLHLLLQRPGIEPKSCDAAAEYLRLHPDSPEDSSPVVLARDLASRVRPDGGPVAQDNRKLALDYLDRAHPSQENNLSVEANLEILSLLVRRSVGDYDEHMAKLGQWETMRQERDSIKKLPELVEAGRFFLVFWHYYETLCVFGLPTEPEVDIDEVRFGDERRVLAEWRAQGEPVPEAMVPGRSGTCFSADFLRYGRALFGDGAENPDLEDAREMFNDRAHDALPALFDRLSSLSSLPESISTLLAAHKAQLLRRAEGSRQAV